MRKLLTILNAMVRDNAAWDSGAARRRLTVNTVAPKSRPSRHPGRAPPGHGGGPWPPPECAPRGHSGGARQARVRGGAASSRHDSRRRCEAVRRGKLKT